MWRSLTYAAWGTGFTFLMTTLGAATVFFISSKRDCGLQKLLLGFSAGVMTAASVWSLLLPAIDQARCDTLVPPWLPATVGILLGVGFLSLLDAVIPKLKQFQNTNDEARRNALLMSAITLHNIPEGMAVGLAFALGAEGESLCAATALALGIGIQNFPEGAAISLPLLRSGQSKRRAFLSGTLSGIVEPLFGMAVVFAAAGAHALLPWLLCFAAGAMIYVVVEELVPQAHSRAGTCGFIGGFLVMMILDVALG